MTGSRTMSACAVTAEFENLYSLNAASDGGVPDGMKRFRTPGASAVADRPRGRALKGIRAKGALRHDHQFELPGPSALPGPEEAEALRASVLPTPQSAVHGGARRAPGEPFQGGDGSKRDLRIGEIVDAQPGAERPDQGGRGNLVPLAAGIRRLHPKGVISQTSRSCLFLPSGEVTVSRQPVGRDSLCRPGRGAARRAGRRRSRRCGDRVSSRRLPGRTPGSAPCPAVDCALRSRQHRSSERFCFLRTWKSAWTPEFELVIVPQGPFGSDTLQRPASRTVGDRAGPRRSEPLHPIRYDAVAGRVE